MKISIKDMINQSCAARLVAIAGLGAAIIAASFPLAGILAYADADSGVAYREVGDGEASEGSLKVTGDSADGSVSTGTYYYDDGYSGQVIGPGGISEEEAEAAKNAEIPDNLKDNVLEYSEIADMVHYYNPTMQQTEKDLESSIKEYQSNADFFSGESLSEAANAADASSDGDSTEAAVYSSNKAVYSSMYDTYKRLVKNLTSENGSTQRSLETTENTLTSTVQALAISYSSLKKQTDIMKETAELYDRYYELAKVRQSSGLATSADVLEAKADAASMHSSYDSMNASLQSVYASICSMLGQSTNSGFTIADVPDIDLSAISSYNLETDTETSVGSSQSVKSARHSSSSSTAESSVKAGNVAASESEVRIKMKELYDAVTQAKLGLDAAELSWQKTQTDVKVAESKWSVGMLSESDYVQQRITNKSAESSYENAKLTLRNAMQEYEWALKGIMST